MRSRRRKKRAVAPLLLTVFALLLLAGALAGFVIGRRYMPGKELADKAELFQVRGDEVAISFRMKREFMRTGRCIFR